MGPPSPLNTCSLYGYIRSTHLWGANYWLAFLLPFGTTLNHVVLFLLIFSPKLNISNFTCLKHLCTVKWLKPEIKPELCEKSKFWHSEQVWILNTIAYNIGVGWLKERKKKRKCLIPCTHSDQKKNPLLLPKLSGCPSGLNVGYFLLEH